MEDTRWTIRVTSSIIEGDISTAYARKHSFVAGDAVSFDVEHKHVSALEYMLGAVALDITGTLRRLAKKRRLDVDALEVLVHGQLHNPMVYLGVVGESGAAGISKIEAKVYISSLEDEPVVKKLWEAMLAVAPIVNTLRSSPESLELKLSYQQVL
jgi:hypothetical protein